jgi:iron(III) transport system substrate-binding protein
MLLTRRLVTLLAVALPLTLSLPLRAEAGPFTPDPIDMAAAKKEGSVSWYTSTPVETAQKLAKKFEEQTGIRVQLFRSGGEAVLRRFMQELDAKRIAADVLTTSDPTSTGDLVRRGALVAFKPEGFDRVPNDFKHPEGYAIAQRLNLLGMQVRTDLVAEADRPKRWSDLTNPKYKGKLVMPDPSFTALQLMAVGTLSQKYGWDFYQKLKANDVMIVQGHQQVSDTLKRGERPISAEGLDSYAYDDRKDGHKIVTVFPADGAFGIPSPTSIIKGSPSPNAAKAFYQFMVSETAQGILSQDGHYPVRTDVKPPEGYPALKELTFMPVAYDYIEKEKQSIKNRFNEIFQ